MPSQYSAGPLSKTRLATLENDRWEYISEKTHEVVAREGFFSIEFLICFCKYVGHG